MKVVMCPHCHSLDTPWRNAIIKCVNCGEEIDCKPRGGHGGKSRDWWKKENTPEATREHTKRCFQSLEQQGKLKMPDHTGGDKKIGENKDYVEYQDR